MGREGGKPSVRGCNSRGVFSVVSAARNNSMKTFMASRGLTVKRV